MAAEKLKPWVEVVSLHPDVLDDDFSEDIFALDFGPLTDGNKTVPIVYQDPEQFFRSSYLTAGLRSLIGDVLSRLSLEKGNRVLKLRTPFGGGKSHTLAAVWHAARTRESLNVIPEGAGFPNPGKVRTAAFDGQFFDALEGKQIPGQGFRARTLWGWIAWSLGGMDLYEQVRGHDESRVSPGGDKIIDMLSNGPNLILLDEVLEYLISAGGVKAGETNLRDETINFIKRLTVAIDNTKDTALVFSLQSSKREALENISLLQTIDHMANRKDQLREPVEGEEILRVIQRRLLAKMPDTGEADPAAMAYQDIYTKMKRAYANTDAEGQQAEADGIALRDRIRASYPFHPGLIDLMKNRWAAIPDFQKTRGVLRFLANCLRAMHRSGKSLSLLGPADVPIYDSDVRRAFFKEVGHKEDFQPALENDIIGVNAHARRIDDRRARETPSEVGKNNAMRIATAILMYSFGGLSREVKGSKDTIPPGITDQELLSVCVGPNLDSTTVLACLKELKDCCLYLHYDGVRYCFKKDPNVTLVVEQEHDSVARDTDLIEGRIKEMLEECLEGHREAIVWPDKPSEITDNDPAFLVAYLPLDFVDKTIEEREALAKKMLERYGDKPRKYRNGLGLAIPSDDQVQALRRAVTYLIAIEQVKQKAKRLNLTDEQKGQLREKETTEKSKCETALKKLYMNVWLPTREGTGIEVEKVGAGGRPLQARVDQNKKVMVHERVMEILTNLQHRVFGSVNPGKIVNLFKLGEGEPKNLGTSTSEIVDGFYSFLGYTRLDRSVAIQNALAKGVEQGFFGYVGGSPPSLGKEGYYEVSPDRIRFKVQIEPDEIDLDSGFILMPEAIPPSPSGPGGPDPVGPGPGGPGPVGPGPGGSGPVGPDGPPSPDPKHVHLMLEMNQDKLFGSWQAVANLAEMSSSIRIKMEIDAESDEPFKKESLRNGVLEPLDELDVLIEEE